MYKIAVFGERDSVLGFSALGLDVYPVDMGDDVREMFRSVVRKNEYAIIYVAESFHEELQNDIDRFKDSVTPAIILIPGAGGNLGIGSKAIDDAVERAIGANII